MHTRGLDGVMDKLPQYVHVREDSSSLRVVNGTEEREGVRVCACSIDTFFFRQPNQQTERRGFTATNLSTW